MRVAFTKSLVCLFLLLLPGIALGGFALEFDRDRCLEVFLGNAEPLNIDDNTITIECWISPADPPGQAPASIIAAKGGAANSGSWKIRVNAEGQFQVRFMINGQGSGWFGTAALEADTWVHAAATYDGDEIRTYINGELISADNYNGNIDSSNEPLWFGRRENDVANFYSGGLDEFRLWDVVRSQEEIQATMNSLIPGNMEGLVGYWRLDEGEGQTTRDETENANHGRLGRQDDEDQHDPTWIESGALVFGGEITCSAESIEFGPVAQGQVREIQFLIANIAEDDDEWHALEFTLTDLGEDPDWLTIEPEEEVIQVGDTLAVTFRANTEGLELGEYERTVMLECNAVNMQRLEMPVNLFVVEGFGRLHGRVTDAANDQPVEGALVSIDVFGFSTNCDENGNYAFPDIPSWTYDMVASMEDYLPLWARGIEINPGEEVRQDFALLHAEFDPDPARIELAMQSDDELVFPLTIHNRGNGPLTWSVERGFEGGADIEPWVFRGSFAAGDSVDDNRMGGIEFAGDNFYIAGGNSGADQNFVYIFDREGNYQDRFPQFAESRYGMRDLACDGELLWGIDGDVIYGFTTDGQLTSEMESPVRSGRSIAYDRDRELLWLSSVTTDIMGIDRDGNEQAEIDRPADTHIYGMAYFPEAPDGFSLYLFTSDGDWRQQVHKVDPETSESQLVGDLTDVEGARAGGLCISGVWDPYSWTFISMLDSPDIVAIWQLAPRTDWLQVDPLFGMIEPIREIDVDVVFNSLGLPEEEVFNANLMFTHDGIGGFTEVPITLQITGVGGLSQRTLRFELGWNMVSLNVAPVVDSIEVIMRPLVDEDLLMLMKDGNGRFYNPEFNFNGIPGWNAAEGYQVKVSQACNLVAEGEVIPWDMAIPLHEGWQMVAYYPRQSVDAVVALSEIANNLFIAKDNLGNFYLPEFNFNNIGDLREGQGYQLKLNANTDLVYSLGDAARVGADVNNRVDPHRQAWVRELPPTGVSYSLLVITDGCANGIHLEAFTPGGIPAGRGIVGSDGRAGIALWGDDPTTEPVEGFITGDIPKIAVETTLFNQYQENHHIAYSEPAYNWLDGDAIGWITDGWGVIQLESLTAPQEFALSRIYPNPFNGNLNIEYTLDRADNINLSVYDVTGREVQSLVGEYHDAGSHRITWNAESYASGVYLVRLSNKQQFRTAKALLLR